MSGPSVHTCPDGSAFRVSVIQTVRDDPLFDGQRFTFRVEPAEGEGTEAFTVTVIYAPIFVDMASPQERLQLDTWAEEMVQGLLDEGHGEAAEIRVTSDGAVKVDGVLSGRLHSLTESA